MLTGLSRQCCVKCRSKQERNHEKPSCELQAHCPPVPQGEPWRANVVSVVARWKSCNGFAEQILEAKTMKGCCFSARKILEEPEEAEAWKPSDAQSEGGE
eukprot:3447094-Rhodomonas_salina.1